MQVSMKIKHRSSTDSNEKRMVYSKSDLNIKNPKNIDENCFQYAITVPPINRETQIMTTICPFINFPLQRKDWLKKQ